MKQLSRKLWLVLMTALSLVCLTLGLVACTNDGGDDNGDETVTLAAPQITLDESTGVISWNAVENATRYDVYKNDVYESSVTATSYTIEETAPGTYEFTVSAYNVKADPATGPRSNAVSYTIEDGGDIGGDEHTHVDQYTSMSDTQHLKTCETCDDVYVLEDHVYDDESDDTCNLCGYVRELGSDVHQHTKAYEQYDDAQHHVYCSDDDADLGYEDHVYSGELDADCDLCGYERHLHSFGYKKVDDDYHVLYCTTADDYESDPEPHNYSSKNDPDCDDCGYTRTLPDGATQSKPIVESSLEGYHFTSELDEAYFRLPSVPGGTAAIGHALIYTITFENGVDVTYINENEPLYSGQEVELAAFNNNIFYVVAQDGAVCGFTVTKTAFDTAKTYDLSVGSSVSVEIGAGEEMASILNLKNVEDGDYIISIGMSIGPTVYVIVGDDTVALTYTDGRYCAEISINGEESIKIYTSESYTTTVLLEKIGGDDDDLPELGFGASNSLTLDLVANGTKYTIKLVDVAEGTYTLTFKTNSYVFWHSWVAEAGENSVSFGSGNGFADDGTWSNDGSIEITIPSGCSELVLYANGPTSGDNGSVTITLSDGSDEGENSGSLTVSHLDLEAGLWSRVDISSLPAGTYSINIYNSTAGSGTPSYKLYFDYLEGDLLDEFSGNPNANGTFVIPEGGESALWIGVSGISGVIYVDITIELIGGGNQGGGGSDTSATINVATTTYVYVEIDVSNLAYGEYTVTLTGDDIEKDWLGWPMLYLASSADGANEVSLVSDDNGVYTCTFTINGSAIYLKAMSWVGTVTVKLEKVGGGDSGNGGSRSDGLALGSSYVSEVDNSRWLSMLTIEIDLIDVPAGNYEISISIEGGQGQPSWMSVEVENVSGEQSVSGGVALITVGATSTKISIYVGNLWTMEDNGTPIPTTITVSLKAV